MRFTLACIVASLTCGFACRGGSPSTSSASPSTPPASAPSSPHAAPATSGKRKALEPSAADAAIAWPPELPSVTTDWCIDDVAALDEETCLVLPARPSRTLLLYLHGIVSPAKTSVQKTNFENVVARACVRAGVVGLMPRGRKGLAPKAFPGWWGWPTSVAAHRKYAPEMTELFTRKREALESVLGIRFERFYVAGSSAGAYFTAALALHGFTADGFGAMSGGSGYETPELSRIPPKPFYIGYGTHDSVGPAARALGALLSEAGWSVRISAHSVGHGAKEIYLDEAFAFWALHDPERRARPTAR